MINPFLRVLLTTFTLTWLGLVACDRQTDSPTTLPPTSPATATMPASLPTVAPGATPLTSTTTDTVPQTPNPTPTPATTPRIASAATQSPPPTGTPQPLATEAPVGTRSGRCGELCSVEFWEGDGTVASVQAELDRGADLLAIGAEGGTAPGVRAVRSARS